MATAGLPCWPSGKAICLESGRPGFNSHCCCWSFSWWSYTSDLKIGTPVAILPGAWHCRVRAGMGWPLCQYTVVSELESLICNLYLSLAEGTFVWTDPSLRYTSMLLGCYGTDKQLKDLYSRPTLVTVVLKCQVLKLNRLILYMSLFSSFSFSLCSKWS